MAENKKGIIVYADWISKFEELEDDEAGRLIKHFFRYVNDLNPVAPDKITKISFIDIQNCLKRDLEKWEQTLEGRSKAGLASAEARKKLKEQNSTNSTSVKSVEQNSTNPTVNVNDTVKDNVKDKDIKKEKLVLPFDSLEFKNKWDILCVQKKWKGKSQDALKASLSLLSQYYEKDAIQMMQNAIAGEYQGLFEIKGTQKRPETEINKELPF